MSDASNYRSTDPAERFANEADFDAVIRGHATPEQFQAVREALRQDPAAVATYLDQVRTHALLEWRGGRVAVQSPGAVSPLPAATAGSRDRRFWSTPRAWAAAAATLVVATVATKVMWRSGHGDATSVLSVVLVDVTDVREVVWSQGQSPLAAGSGVGAGEISIQSGTLRFRSRADVDIAIAGPARVRLVTAAKLTVLSGRVTARVGPTGKGFVVEAPGGDVVDLGTEFGVQVGPNGQTAVVVFDGAVELHPKPAIARSGAATLPTATPPAGQSTRLTRGQAVRIEDRGTLARIASVDRQPGAADWSLDAGAGEARNVVISSVRDNIRDPAGAKFYQIVHHGLAEDVRAYVDRPHEWNGVDARGIPPELLGADLLMTFNDDKRAYALELSVTLARPAAVYVLFKPRGPEVPDWLRHDFVDTGLTMGMDEGPPDLPNSTLGKGPGVSIDRVFHIWRRDVRSPGTITLGPNLPENNSMYAVAAVPLPTPR